MTNSHQDCHLVGIATQQNAMIEWQCACLPWQGCRNPDQEDLQDDLQSCSVCADVISFVAMEHGLFEALIMKILQKVEVCLFLRELTFDLQTYF